MASLRTKSHPGWVEAALDEYASFDDFWAELESVRGSGSVHACVVTGHGFRDPGEEVTLDQARRFERFELPAIFAFDGALEGSALRLALACDIRICGANASFRVPLGSRRALALIGAEASADLLARRGRVGAPAALACGIVSRVGADEAEALRDARALASVIASRGPVAVRLAKEAIWRGLELPFEHALRFETDLTLLLQTTKDRAEGVRAFVEKREPNFTGE
ncbi:MAG: hypothetical protein C0506_09545 [Anaerolinea sp.]|nr:hypothetical protein [Anaerolinea sp.]